MKSPSAVRTCVDLGCLVALVLGCGLSEHSNPTPAHTGGVGANGGATPSSGGSGGLGGAQAGQASGGEPSGGTNGLAECPRVTSNHTPGSRIHGQYAVTEAGDRYWLGWYDSELDVPCEFYALYDGEFHCAPSAGSFSREFYTNAGCTDKAYTRGLYDRCGVMNFIFLYDPPECALPPFPYYRFFDLGDAVPSGSDVYVLNGTACVAAAPPAEPLYRRGPEVDYATRFVSATYGPLTGGGRLQGYGVTASDGTRQLTRWRDNTLELDCRLDRAEHGERRCVPIFTSYVQNFADAACSLPVAEPAYTCDDSAPAYALQPQPRCPAAANRLFTSGARFDEQLYTAATGTCAPLTTDPTDSVHYTTQPAPPTLFQDVEISIDMTAPGRLKPQFASADGGCWFDGVWDSQFETKCAFDLAGDGVQRCLPSVKAYESVQIFEDEACTVSRFYAGPFQCGSTPVEPFAFVGATSDDCTYSFGVYRTGELVTNEALGAIWQKTQSGCTQVTLTAGDYAPLTLVDPSEFVAATLVTE